MTTLITGGAGYIGSHVAVSLVEAGLEVVLLDNFCNSDPFVLNRLERLLGKKIQCVRGDVRDFNLVRRTLRDFGVTSVIHMAGLKAVGESCARPLVYFDVNVGGAIQLLSAMVAERVKNLVFSSSATVYGVPNDLPLNETHTLRPCNPYGWSKLHIEQIIHDTVKANSDSLRAVCLRYFNPAGAHESGLLGEDPVGQPSNLIPFIGLVAAGETGVLEIYGNDYDTPDGSGVRDYVHVQDLADGHLAALRYVEVGGGSCVLNLGTGRGYSVFEVVKEYERVTGRGVPYIISGRREGDVPAVYANVDFAKKLLGWSATRGLADMCSSSWNWHCGRQRQPLN
jgi:UDP-glucose 4-epimerase